MSINSYRDLEVWQMGIEVDRLEKLIEFADLLGRKRNVLQSSLRAK